MAASEALAKFSLALGAKRAAPPPTRTKRPHSSLHDEDDEEVGGSQPQQVSHFDQSAGGAIDASDLKKEKGPLVIPTQGNRDWREESRRKRQRNLLPAEAQAAQANGVSTTEDGNTANGASITYGLHVVQKTVAGEPPTTNGEATITQDGETSLPQKQKTDDELALEALLGDKPQSTLVLPTVHDEDEAFRRDYRDAPDMASLEAYAAVPVEEFGAAMLRGMGWKDGEPIGKRRGQQAAKPRVVERRPALLGIGAKDAQAAGVELGTWGKAAKGRKKVDQAYNPVLLRNKVTGEQLTEEELRAKLEEQKMAEMEQSRQRNRHSPARDSNHRSTEKQPRRQRYDDSDPDRKDVSLRRHKHNDEESGYKEKDQRQRDKNRDYDRSRHGASRRDRSSSADSRRRSRKHDDYRDDRRDRKQRDRDDRYDGWERDERYDDRGSSRREHRDKDRHRDSDRRRKEKAY